MRQVRTMRTSERVYSWLSERVHPNHRTSESDLEAGPKLTGLPKNTTILQLLIGSMMAMVAGTLFGTTFVLPTDLLQGDFGKQHSRSIMDYVFSHFTGIFLMAAFALMCYVAIRGKKKLRTSKPRDSCLIFWSHLGHCSGGLVSGEFGFGLFSVLPGHCEPSRSHRAIDRHLLLWRSGELLEPRFCCSGAASPNSRCCPHCAVCIIGSNTCQLCELNCGT